MSVLSALGQAVEPDKVGTRLAAHVHSPLGLYNPTGILMPKTIYNVNQHILWMNLHCSMAKLVFITGISRVEYEHTPDANFCSTYSTCRVRTHV